MKFTFVLLFLVSCASINQRQLQPEPKISKLLPPLEPRVDLYSLETLFSAGTSQGTSVGYATATSSNSAIGVATTNTVHSKDQRVQDAITIFDRDVKDNITNPIGRKAGYISLKITNGSAEDGARILAFFSGFTLGILNILGMPAQTSEVEVDATVEVYDLNENLVGRYNGHCLDKQYAALYYGYTFSGARRAAALNAMKCSLNKIKENIDKDFERLNSLLVTSSK